MEKLLTHWCAVRFHNKELSDLERRAKRVRLAVKVTMLANTTSTAKQQR